MLSFCICLSILTGCGSSPKNDQTQQKATETQMAETEQDTSLEDGEYTANVKLEGGSGRASVDSDAKIKVTDGQAYATIVWSSSHYDYMLVDGQKYENENSIYVYDDIIKLSFSPIIRNTNCSFRRSHLMVEL